jgi:hypothetical protein
VVIDPSFEEALLPQPPPKEKSAMVSQKYLSVAFVISYATVVAMT